MADYDIQVRVDASSAEASIEGLQSSLEGVADKADDAGSEIGERITKGADEARSKGGKHLDEINERLKSMGRLVKEAFAFAGIGLGIRELARMGDELTNVRNQVRELVGSQKELDQTITQLFGVARRSRAEFGAVADLFDNLSKSTRQYGLSNQQVLRLTESLTKSIVAEGRSVGEAAGAVRGLSIAFSTGTVNAGNMRRLLGQFPELADIIANNLGKTRQELFKMAEQGKITGATLIRAFLESSRSIDEDFGQKVPTISQSLTVLQVSFQEFLDTANKGTGVLALLSRGILFVADNLGLVATVLVGVVTGFLAMRIVGAVVTAFRLLAGAIAAVNIALLFMVRNPIVLALVAMSALVLATKEGRQAIADLFGEVTKALGIDKPIEEIAASVKRLAGDFIDTGGNVEDTFDRITGGASDAAGYIRNLSGETDGLAAANDGVARSVDGVSSAYKRAADSAYSFASQVKQVSNIPGNLPGNVHTLDQLLAAERGGYDIPINDTSSLRGYAGGGRPQGGRPIIVGERGPELMIPTTSSLVLPNDITQELLRRGIPGLARGGFTVPYGANSEFIDWRPDVPPGDPRRLGNRGGGGGRSGGGGGGGSGGGSYSGAGAGGRDYQLMLDNNILEIGLSNSYESFQDVYNDAARRVRFVFQKDVPADKLPDLDTGGRTRKGGGGRKTRADGVLDGGGGAFQALLDSGDYIVYVLAGAGGIGALGPQHFDNQLLRITARNLTAGQITDPTDIPGIISAPGFGGIDGDPIDDILQGKYTIKNRTLYTWDQAASDKFRADLSAIPVGARIDTKSFDVGINRDSNTFHHKLLGGAGYLGSYPDRSVLPDLARSTPESWSLEQWERGKKEGYNHPPGPGWWYRLVGGGWISEAEYDAIPIKRSPTRYGTGGRFMVGGTGPVDSQLIQFMASPGEQVTIRKPGQSDRDGTVNVTVNVHGVTDAASFRKSRTQITAELAAEIRRVNKRIST